MAKLGETYVEVRADVDRLRKDFNNLKREVGQKSEETGGVFKNKMLGAIGAVTAAIFALKKAWDFGVEAKNAARDAEEISSKFATVFESIGDKAQNAAQNLAKNFGLANSTAKELLSSTGDLLVGFNFAEDQALDLSTRVNELAVDLASFSNYAGGAKGASEALTKALLGETESAKSLGIVIRQNTKEFQNQVKQLVKTKGYTEQQAKAVIILDQAYAQSKKAVGDFARTQDSLANQERIMTERFKEFKEEMGKGIIPTVQASLGYFNSLFTSISEGNTLVELFSGTVKTLATALIGVVSGIKVIASLLGGFGAAVAKVFTGDFAGAGDVLSRSWDIAVKDASDAGNSIKEIWSDAAESYKGSTDGIVSSNNQISQSAIDAKNRIQEMIDLSNKLSATQKDLTGVGKKSIFLETQKSDTDTEGALKTVEEFEQGRIDLAKEANRIIGVDYGQVLTDSLSQGASIATRLSNTLSLGAHTFVAQMANALSIADQIIGIISQILGLFNIFSNPVSAVASAAGGVAPQAPASNNTVRALNLNQQSARPIEIPVFINGSEFARQVIIPDTDNVNRTGFKSGNS